MRSRGSIWTTLACGALVVMLGCRTAQPDLKPPVAKEVLNKPPDEARFNSAAYPKQAMVSDGDPTKKWDPSAAGAMPTRGMGGGGMGGGGMGGAPGMGGFGR
jgi:hypothetical protein